MDGNILLVDDDVSILLLVSDVLEENGMNVVTARSGEEAVRLMEGQSFDLILLDIMMKGLSGLDVCRKIRSRVSCPILFLSAKDSVKDIVAGLDLGADDYLTKPFGGGELLARIRTALRHTRTQAADPGLARTGIYRCGRLRVDFDSHLVWLGEENVHLTQSEYRIVALLTQYAGKVLTYDFIIREIWGPNAVGDTQNLRANMAKIRRKLEKNPAKPQYIFTEVGVGYRMAEGD